MSWAKDTADRMANEELDAGSKRTDDMDEWPDLHVLFTHTIRAALEEAAELCEGDGLTGIRLGAAIRALMEDPPLTLPLCQHGRTCSLEGAIPCEEYIRARRERR